MAQHPTLILLQDQSKEELIDRVLRLHDLVDRLQEQLAEAQRAGKRQAAPFGRDKPKAEPKKAGRKPGEGTFNYRQAPAPEEVTATKWQLLHGCPCCGGALTDVRPREQHVVDIPRVERVITCYETQSGWCAQCGKRQHSRHPEQISQAFGAAGVSVGPHALGLATDMKHRLGLSYEKIEDFFQQTFGLSVSRSALCQADQRLAVKALPVYEELIESLRLCTEVHADETGWRIGGLSAWLWVFTNQRLTLYTVENGRSHEVVLKMLGDKFGGTLISDCFCAYDHHKFAAWAKQKCLGHLVKDLSLMEQQKAGPALRFARDVAKVLRAALALRDDKPQLSTGQFKRRAHEIETQLDVLIDSRRRFSDLDNRRFAKRLRKHRKHLLRFLYHDGVDATNNQAERMLRPAVIVRKTGGCNRTAAGAKTHAVLASLLVTARQRGLSPQEAMVQLQRLTTAAFCGLLDAALVPTPAPP